MTERETQALILITAGLSLAEVGAAMGLSMPTVKTYSATILDAFGMHNGRGTATLALLSGTVTAEQVVDVWRAWRPWLVK
ncbi:MAG: response regulator transcription factor [Rhizobiales bacterium]|nr:response regulator transcription factor [Hyphomicrobiales bacterium]